VRDALLPVVSTKRARQRYKNDLTRCWLRKYYGSGARKRAYSVKSRADGIRRMKPISILELDDYGQVISKLTALVSVYLRQASLLIADMRQKSLFENRSYKLVETEISKIQNEVDRVLAAFGYTRAA
jgi:hypothetical protein